MKTVEGRTRGSSGQTWRVQIAFADGQVLNGLGLSARRAIRDPPKEVVRWEGSCSRRETTRPLPNTAWKHGKLKQLDVLMFNGDQNPRRDSKNVLLEVWRLPESQKSRI